MQLFTTRTATIAANTAIILILAVASIFALLTFFKTTSVGASATAGFRAGRIIDDAVFYNGNSMSASQVQTFLNSKVTCDTNGSGRATDWKRPDITRATLASYIRSGTNGYSKNTNFHAPPYTCLKDFKQNTPQIAAASGLCSGVPAQKSRTAAQIIVDISKACGINPQVLLVLLEKEQSLVTDIWPIKHQFNRATGFACPDNVGGACDPKYNGFYSQVYSAARQFKVYKARPNDYNYVAGRSNNLLWQVAPKGIATFINNSGSPSNRRSGHCGHSQVYIENQATAALYVYTPYQPNSAALRSYPGTGDACSAYGNRNFYGMFTSWFGSTQDPHSYNFEDLVSKNGVIKNTNTVGSAMETVSIGNKIYNFYYDQTSKTLNLTKWNGTKWTDSVIDGSQAKTKGSVNSNLNITAMSGFNYGGKIQLYYYDSVSKSIRHLFEKDGTLQTETLDGATSGVIGKKRNVGTAITSMTYNGDWIQLFYYNTDTGNLEHTWWNSQKRKWFTETLDGATSGVIKRNSDVGNVVAGKVYKNDIQLFYHSKSSGELIHTWWSDKNRKWQTERMDGDTNTTLGNYINAGKEIAMSTYKDKLFVAYYDDATGFGNDKKSSWRIAYWSGSSWIQNTLEGGSGGLSNPAKSIPLSDISMALHGNHSLQLTYKGTENQLRHSWIK